MVIFPLRSPFFGPWKKKMKSHRSPGRMFSHFIAKKCHKKKGSELPSGCVNIAIENGHRNSGFTY